MSDTAIGFALLGITLVVVLGVVFIIASRAGPATESPKPPPGVHMPGPSFLPVVLSVGAALLGAAFAYRGDWGLANPFLAVPGLILFVAGAVAWVRAANHEWRETEHASHDEEPVH